jgi:hypothetical protein
VLPRVGPQLFSVREFDAVTIGAGLAVGASSFRWPRDLFVTGISWLPETGDPAELANLRVRISDETFQEVFADGQGFTFDVPGVLLGGIAAQVEYHGFRRWPLQRPVAAGDQWFFTMTNTSAADIDVAGLYLFIEEPR